MPDDRVEHTKEIREETSQRVKNPVLSSGIKKVLAILIALVLIGGLGYIIYKIKNRNTQNSDSSDQIHNTFNPPASTSPTFVPPVPGATTGPFTAGPNFSTSSPQANLPVNPSTVPNSNQNPAVQGQSPILQPQQQAPAGPIVYQNSGAGFSLTIPGNWTVDDRQSADHIVFFDRNTGQIAGYMEIYSSQANSSLDGLARMLQGSPSVSGIRTISVAGQPAIQYSAAPGYTGGIATIYNNRIYYFHGKLADPGVLTSLKFL